MITSNQAFERYLSTTRTLLTDIESVYEHNPALAQKLARMIDFNNRQLADTLNQETSY